MEHIITDIELIDEQKDILAIAMSDGNIYFQHFNVTN